MTKILNLLKSEQVILLILIFLLALAVRFLYFPDNVYFGYDQARDSFAALDILKGNLKVIGPPSSISSSLFHGPLIYYIYAPIYFLSDHNPEVVSFIFRIINATGIFLVFYISKIIFNKWIGVLAAFIYAISYEESQYALFLSHPSLAPISVLVFYLGLALLIFHKQTYGLIIASLGLGLSIQFHYINGYLVVPLMILAIVYREQLPRKIKPYLLSFAMFLLIISSFIIAEIKFHFREIAFFTSSHLKPQLDLIQFKVIGERMVHDNLFANFSALITILILAFLILLLRNTNFRSKLNFLIIWLFSGFIPYFISASPSYYYNPGVSVSLIIICAFLLFLLWKNLKILAAVILILISISNINLVIAQNQNGLNTDFIIQPGMLTSDEKKVLDYIYNKTPGQPFAVGALTVPLNVNTTWCYLFEWYGQEKYGYLPTWFGETAKGFPGNLSVETSRDKLPENQFIIIEPTIGIDQGTIVSYFQEEGYFTKVIEEKKFGTITVQYRKKY